MAGCPAPAEFGMDATSTQGTEVRYWLKWTNTNATSPTLPTSASQGVTSVTYSATGVLTIVLQNNCYQYLMVRGEVQQASYNASTGACRIRPVSQDPTTATVVVTLENAAGTAVAGATGDVIMIEIVAQNSKTQMG